MHVETRVDIAAEAGNLLRRDRCSTVAEVAAVLPGDGQLYCRTHAMTNER